MSRAVKADIGTCAGRLRLLAEPTRLAALRLIADGALSVNEIASRLGVEQTLLSHHLALLRRGGLVRAHRQGKCWLYGLAPSVRMADAAEGIDLGCCALRF